MLQNILNSDKPKFHASERLMLTVTLFAAVINVVLIFWKGSSMDWLGFGGSVALSIGLILAGLVYRLSERSERFAMAMIGAGLFILFSTMLSLYNYLLLPLVNPTIDLQIAKWDAALGFYWPDAMAWAAQNLFVSDILRVTYLTTIPQVALLVVILGMSGRQLELHRLLVAVTLTATFAICFWGLYPTMGTSQMYELPDELWNSLNPVVNKAYGQYLSDVAVNGPGLITPSEVRGLIGFPSYHAVLAFTAIYASRTIKWAFPVFLAVNIVILPATIIHGGHHLLDLPAGFVVFLAGAIASNWAVGRDYGKRKAPAICPA